MIPCIVLPLTLPSTPVSPEIAFFEVTTSQQILSVLIIPRFSAGPDVSNYHCHCENLPSLSFCDSAFSWFLSHVLKSFFKIKSLGVPKV